MTFDELIRTPKDAPVMLADGAFGMLIRTARDAAGVQVYGEENIRWIPLAHIHDLGGGALVEQKVAAPDQADTR